MRLLVAFAIAAACASCGAPPEMLTVRIGMPASEVNRQAAMSDIRKFKTGSSDWIGHNGPLDLHLLLNRKTIRIPVSGWNGGLQLSTWNGIRGEYGEGRLNTIAAAVEPQRIDWDRAFAIAQAFCVQAREAGLTTDNGSREPNTDRDNMNGVAVCSVRDETQVFAARVVPLGRPPSGKYRVEVTATVYFDLAL